MGMQRLPLTVEIRTSRKCPATSDRQICVHHWGSESCPNTNTFPFLFPCFNCSYIVLIEARKHKRKGIKNMNNRDHFKWYQIFLYYHPAHSMRLGYTNVQHFMDQLCLPTEAIRSPLVQISQTVIDNPFPKAWQKIFRFQIKQGSQRA